MLIGWGAAIAFLGGVSAGGADDPVKQVQNFIFNNLYQFKNLFKLITYFLLFLILL